VHGSVEALGLASANMSITPDYVIWVCTALAVQGASVGWLARPGFAVWGEEP